MYIVREMWEYQEDSKEKKNKSETERLGNWPFTLQLILREFKLFDK